MVRKDITRPLTPLLTQFYQELCRRCAGTATWTGAIADMRQALGNERIKTEDIHKKLESLLSHGLVDYTTEKQGGRLYWTVTLKKGRDTGHGEHHRT